MRLLPLLVLGAILLPLAVAAPIRDDSTHPFMVGDTVYYLSLCRNDVRGNAPAVSLVDDCMTSGVYAESNKIYGLQVRAGVDERGHPYQADIVVASVESPPAP